MSGCIIRIRRLRLWSIILLTSILRPCLFSNLFFRTRRVTRVLIHRLFQIKVVNLRDRTTRDLCGTYVYLAGDEEDYDDHVNEIMTMPLMHMKGIISGTYRRNSLYVVDNSELAACNNYHNAIASFF